MISLDRVQLQHFITDLFVFWRDSPPFRSGPGPPLSLGFKITHNDAAKSVGHLWTSDQLVAEIITHLQYEIHIKWQFLVHIKYGKDDKPNYTRLRE
jgi:hypothetical protein